MLGGGEHLSYETGHQRAVSLHVLLYYLHDKGLSKEPLFEWAALMARKVPGRIVENRTMQQAMFEGLRVAAERKLLTRSFSYIHVADMLHSPVLKGMGFTVLRLQLFFPGFSSFRAIHMWSLIVSYIQFSVASYCKIFMPKVHN